MSECMTLAYVVKAETKFGQTIKVVGSKEELGNWNVQRAPSLSTDATEYPKWSGTLPCTVGELEFKFVKVAENGDAEWEDGKNRSIKISEDGDIVIPNGSATPNTMTFGHTEETNAPRLASGGSRKTSFSDEVEEVAVPVPITPKTKVPTSLLDESDELHFNVVCSITGIGDAVSVVGSCPELGNWDVRRGIKLCTSADLFPQWAGVLHLKSCSFCDIEFKIVVCRISCDEWEGTQNRRLSMPGDDLEGPWEAFLSFNVNGCRIAKFRTTPVNLQQTSMESPDDVKFALKTNMIDIVEPETGRRERRARRSTSLSLLAPREQPPLVAETWVRCRNDREEAVAGPPLKEHLLMLKLKGIPQSEARKLFVELVFEAKSQRPIVPLDMSSFDNDELQAAWSVAIPAVELPVGTNYFHFRVNGVFTLSLEHNRVGKWNAVYNSDSIRRYLLARDGRGQLLDKKEGQMVEKTRSKQIGDMAFDLIVGDASSANQSGLQADREGQIARPYSVCGHLGLADAGEDNETKAVAKRPNQFADEVFEGLFDEELVLRLDGVLLPEVPQQPPLGLDYDEHTGTALRLWAGASMLKKAHGACEDAFFMDAHALGVADGVGCMVQFASYGINAAQYAAELMECASKALKDDGLASENKIANDVALRALTAVLHAESHAAAYGASTVAVLCQQGAFVGVANLGDSGFMVLRKGTHGYYVVLKSEEQQHSWNCPYQLTRLPKTLLTRFPKLQLDKAKDCETYTVPIKEGDLVVMFSDGLRDNLHDREVISIVNQCLAPPFADMVGLLDRCTPPETVAKALALAAQERSLDPTARVPFVDYSKRHGFDCIGGKQDDITVVAAWVVLDESKPDPDALDIDELLDDMLIAEEEAEERALQGIAESSNFTVETTTEQGTEVEEKPQESPLQDSLEVTEETLPPLTTTPEL